MKKPQNLLYKAGGTWHAACYLRDRNQGGSHSYRRLLASDFKGSVVIVVSNTAASGRRLPPGQTCGESEGLEAAFCLTRAVPLHSSATHSCRPAKGVPVLVPRVARCQGAPMAPELCVRSAFAVFLLLAQ